ncbi:MAG: DegT/DnrJ/EryC1/StrS family aminotransferase [Crenarchaeota archaeon]|nr:DegT/DnrJ/EryC1/StrS family aminotransferase [Thermoproteota archaeon]
MAELKPAILGGEPVTKRKIPFTQIVLTDDESQAISDVLKTKNFVCGDYTELLEREFARYVGTKHAIAVSNGTDGLFLSFLALDITFGSRVVTTPLTFVASASTILHTGAVPVFVDVLPDGNLDPRKVSEVDNFNAICLVHLYGLPVDFDDFQRISVERGIPIIEDASHAHGAEYNGRKVGSLGDIAVFSLYPSKIIAAGGWGGIITTNADELNEKLRLLRAHGELRVLAGEKGAYEYIRLGYNLRMSEIEAAVAYFQLRKLDKFVEARRRLASYLTELLSDVPGIKLPKEPPGKKHAFYIYAIQIDPSEIGWTRDAFVDALNAEGISARAGYHTPLHKTKLFQNINDPRINHFARVVRYPDYASLSLPLAESLARTTVWLPMYPTLSLDEVEQIARAVKKLVDWGIKHKT